MSGPDSTFNRFIERSKDYLYTGIEVLEVPLIQNATEKYNTTVSAKEWNKTDPRYAKIPALTTSLYKLEGNQNYVLATV